MENENELSLQQQIFDARMDEIEIKAQILETERKYDQAKSELYLTRSSSDKHFEKLHEINLDDEVKNLRTDLERLQVDQLRAAARVEFLRRTFNQSLFSRPVCCGDDC